MSSSLLVADILCLGELGNLHPGLCALQRLIMFVIPLGIGGSFN
jgi:hypothetical protein